MIDWSIYGSIQTLKLVKKIDDKICSIFFKFFFIQSNNNNNRTKKNDFHEQYKWIRWTFLTVLVCCLCFNVNKKKKKQSENENEKKNWMRFCHRIYKQQKNKLCKNTNTHRVNEKNQIFTKSKWMLTIIMYWWWWWCKTE